MLPWLLAVFNDALVAVVDIPHHFSQCVVQMMSLFWAAGHMSLPLPDVHGVTGGPVHVLAVEEVCVEGIGIMHCADLNVKLIRHILKGKIIDKCTLYYNF